MPELTYILLPTDPRTIADHQGVGWVVLTDDGEIWCGCTARDADTRPNGTGTVACRITVNPDGPTWAQSFFPQAWADKAARGGN